jgi:hypothetical protein
MLSHDGTIHSAVSPLACMHPLAALAPATQWPDGGANSCALASDSLVAVMPLASSIDLW